MNFMNKKQKAVIWVALVLFVLTLFNAPWKVTRSRETWISERATIWNAPRNGTLMGGALLLEWAAIGVVCGVVLFLFKERNV